MSDFSPLRARLASFDHAYAVAHQRYRATGVRQYVVRTGNPLQPVRVTATDPHGTLVLLAMVA